MCEISQFSVPRYLDVDKKFREKLKTKAALKKVHRWKFEIANRPIYPEN